MKTLQQLTCAGNVIFFWRHNSMRTPLETSAQAQRQQVNNFCVTLSSVGLVCRSAELATATYLHFRHGKKICHI